MKKIKIRTIVAVIICAALIVLIHGYISMLSLCDELKDGYVYSDAMRNIDMTEYEIDKIFYTDKNQEEMPYIVGLNEGILANVIYRKLYMSLRTERNSEKEEDAECDVPLMFKKAVPENVFEEAFNVYKKIYGDVKYFPVPKDVGSGVKTPYDDSWNSARNYGGDRKHEGTDIMAGNNKSGYFPVVSMTDGVVEKKGWLELGGYRLGIRSPGGAYFYYAHLAAYADGIEEGTHVTAGTVIGTMGDTGYGKEEGTSGKFDVHLHLGVYCDRGDDEVSFNPYCVLKSADGFRKEFVP